MDRNDLLGVAGETLAFAEDYLDSRVKYYKLALAKRGANSAAVLLSFAIICLFGVFALASLSVALAIFIGEKVQSAALGFVLVGILYILLSAVLLWLRKPLLTHPILQTLVKSLFKPAQAHER